MFNKNDKALILKQIKTHLKIKKDVDFANFLGIKPQTLNTWYTRNTFDYDLLYAKCIDIDGNFLLTGSGNMLRNNIDLLNTENVNLPVKIRGLPLIRLEDMAGKNQEEMNALELYSDYYSIPEFNKKADYLIRISGDSMAPKYFNGDIVACKKIPLDTFIQWGKVYVMDTVQGALCKRIENIENEQMLVVSDNDKYKPFKMNRKEIRSLAIVIGVIRLE